MALRKPLVMVNGRVQQLQSGDVLDASVTEVDVINMTNGEGGSTAHTIGQVVYISAAGTVKLAKANAIGTSDAIALVKDTSIADGASGYYITNGYLGGLSGLTPGARYYLSSATAGAITVTAPTANPNCVVPLGFALSTTEFWIDIEEAILL